MPNGESVVLLKTWVAEVDRNPLATPVAIGSGVFCSSGVVALAPSPTSPRRYQPMNSTIWGGASGSCGAGGGSAAFAHPQLAAAAPAMATSPSLAVTTIPSFGLEATRAARQQTGENPSFSS
jgi:hypothetical protein